MTMADHTPELRPGLHFHHLRQIVRLRRASSWLGILSVVAVLVFFQLHRHDPALFQAADPYAARGGATPGRAQQTIWPTGLR